MKEEVVREFAARVIVWARKQWLEEYRTGFGRTRMFDAFWTKDLLSVLLRQPAENVEILAHVLPEGVFWETEEALSRRESLPPKARHAVQQMRNDYDIQYEQDFQKHIDSFAQGNRTDVKREFMAATRLGNQLVMQVADRLKCSVAGGGCGEWGLVSGRNWGSIIVSLNLGRNMALGYMISVFDKDSHAIRRNDHYLGVLGLGAGEWTVESSETFPQKFSLASEFAIWHLHEYENIICELQFQGIWPT